MAYTKTNWINGQTPINATNLNHIEDGIEAALEKTSVKTTATQSDSDTYACNYLNQHLYDMYSENEVLTNKIWIDGRPIYRKVISGSINSSTGSIQVSDLETLVKYYGNCTLAGSNDKRPFPFYELNASGHLFDFSIFGNGYINYNSTWNSATYQIIIEYTKTTDSGDR